MKNLILVLAVWGLLASVPTESKAQVVISVQPGHTNGYYYHRSPYYGHHYHHYYHRYYHSHYWHHDG